MNGEIPDDLAKLEPEKLNDVARTKGEEFAKNIRVSQIRNIYSAITRIRNEYQRSGKRFDAVHRRLVLLRPRLAYAAGRNREVGHFQCLFDKAIQAVLDSSEKDKALENFFALAEAVVAYHKFYGAKD
jgi:CRISPR-associated protein Csm2